MELRNSSLILSIALFLSIIACEEEIIGPLFNDGQSPGQITNVTFQPKSGGAKIIYKLPADEDLLLVRAEYTLANGEEAVVKSSKHNNSLEVVGLLDSLNTHTVKLFSEDGGGNLSQPLNIEITIKEAPIYKAARTVKFLPDFGGLRVLWANPAGKLVNFRLLTPDDQGFPLALVTKTKTDNVQDIVVQRGFNTDLRKFTVEISDRWGNVAPLIHDEFRPLLELLVPKSDMSDPKLPHDMWDNGPSVPWSNMWNAIDADGNSIPGEDVYVRNRREWLTADNNGTTRDPNPLPEYAPPNRESHLKTIDLGRTVKLSRFKYWDAFPYQWASVRLFDLWVRNDPPNPEGTMDGWTKVFSNAEIIKPSGAPHLTTTQEDRDLAAKGFEFLFPLEMDAVRYIRFAFLDNFLPPSSIVFDGQELDFYGSFDLIEN